MGTFVPAGKVMELARTKDREYPYTMSFMGRNSMKHIRLKQEEVKILKKEDWTADNLKFWKDKDSGLWCCAVPRDDIATQNGFHWKKFGLIGRGKTRKEAQEDWEMTKRCSDFVADIY